MVPGESSCLEGSEYVCQMGEGGVFKTELRPAEVDPRFRKRETKIALSKKTNTLKQVVLEV